MADAQVAILMGSDSDLPIMKAAGEALEKLGVDFEMRVLSAHRTPKEACDYAESARARGVKAFICGAGGAAHLAGVIAAHTELPVIGVPIGIEPLKGQDSLLSTVQMPRGIPVATVGIDNAFNAGILAAQICGALDNVKKYKQELREKVLAKKI